MDECLYGGDRSFCSNDSVVLAMFEKLLKLTSGHIELPCHFLKYLLLLWKLYLVILVNLGGLPKLFWFDKVFNKLIFELLSLFAAISFGL